MENAKVDLNGVQETLLMPLWGRAIEANKVNPVLMDNEAVRIINSINYDFSIIERKISPISIASWISRSIYFDEKVKEYLAENPNGTIINIGCGLDTTYERVDNGKAQWYELDFPDVIKIRKELIKETSNRTFLSFSVFDKEWYSNIAKKDDVFIIMAGVIYYFNENEIKILFESFMNQFNKTTLVIDYTSRIGVKIANKNVIQNGGMDDSVYLKWGIDDISKIEYWNNKIKVIENMKLFKLHKKKYPIQKRIGMWVSDALSIMSLAKIVFE